MCPTRIQVAIKVHWEGRIRIDDLKFKQRMKTMRIKLMEKMGGYSVVWALLAVALLWGGCNFAPNYERETHKKLTGFFSEELPLTDFSMNSPWKSTFKPDNIKKRAPVDIQGVELLEVRLPGSPGGLEAAFRVTLKAAEPFQNSH